MLTALDIFFKLWAPIFKKGAEAVLQLLQCRTAVPSWENFILEIRLWQIVEPQNQQENCK